VVGHSVNARRAYDALVRVGELVEEFGNEEQKARLSRITGGYVPPPSRSIEYTTYQSEALVILFEMLGPVLEDRKPKKRGRPRKQEAS
jgi:hypothetical protein